MPDILKVSVPTSGYENNVKTNPITINDAQIPNIVDPSKVTRPDGQQASLEQQLSLFYESNFDGFISALRNSPDVVELFSQIFFQMGIEVKSGIGDKFAEELAKFLQMTKMSEGDLLSFIKNQAESSMKFQGPFFQLLQQVMNQTSSTELQREILNFLKTYNSVDSSASTMNNMYSILDNIAKYLTSNYRAPLEQLMQKLHLPQAFSSWQGSDPANIALLKKEIIPFLSNYIKQTNDMGPVRNLITMLMLNIAKYENGSMGRLTQAFERLMNYQDFNRVLGNMKPEDLRQILLEKTGQAYADQFHALVERGIKGEAGLEAKSVFQNIMQSLLLNESVYMPLQHFMIPIDLMGKMLFSEIWVDPNHKRKNEKGETRQSSKLLIKFDIKDVGFFDLIIVQEDRSIDLQLYYPASFADKEKQIQKDIAQLVEKNGLILRTALYARSWKPKTISEVFPQIYERKNAINVKI